MRTFVIVIAAVMPLAAQPGRGTPAPKSPEVAADGRVTLRLRAANAKEVAVTGLGERLAMTKDDKGVWSVTTEPLKPEIYTYSFSVDGANFPDPGNALLKTSYGSVGQSMVRVPGTSPQPWDPNTPGPHGVVSHHVYHSAIVGADRDYYVYTPPNYDANRREVYPVLFLLHGLGDDAAGWTTVGAANSILDNLINSGKAKPMVMVNTLGYGTPEGPQTAMSPVMIPTFAKALVDEVMPQVEKSYHVSKDRAQHAIAGLSMGGAESVYIGLHNIDKFAYIGSFSGAYVMWPRANPPAPPAEGGRAGGGRGGPPVTDADFEKNFPELSSKAASRLKMMWIACGTEDGLINVNRQFKTWLKSKDVSFTESEIPGYAHVWPLWRLNLAEMAQKLF